MPRAIIKCPLEQSKVNIGGNQMPKSPFLCHVCTWYVYIIYQAGTRCAKKRGPSRHFKKKDETKTRDKISQKVTPNTKTSSLALPNRPMVQ